MQNSIFVVGVVLITVIVAGLAKFITDFEKIRDAWVKFKLWRIERKRRKWIKLSEQLAPFCPNIGTMQQILATLKDMGDKLDRHIKKDMVNFADRIYHIAETKKHQGYFSIKDRRILSAQAYEYFLDGGNSDAGDSFKEAMTLPYIEGGAKVDFDFNKFMESGGKIF